MSGRARRTPVRGRRRTPKSPRATTALDTPGTDLAPLPGPLDADGYS
ncbi:hypothetical protein [Streptomyces sp. NPDC059788]